jgi:hypothetical protein
VKLLLDELRNAPSQARFGRPRGALEEAGFKGLENGDLLNAASGSYEVLITVDRNIPYQQNVAGLNIALLILAAKRNSYVRLRPLIPRTLSALETMKVGDVIRIDE